MCILFPTVERVTVCLYCGIVIASHECSEPLTWCGVPPWQYPLSWTVDDQGDTVQINPSSKEGGIIYFSVGLRKDFKSLEDIKKTLAPSVQTTPIQISTGSGFTYTDTDGHESIWISHADNIYIIRTYTISDQAHQVLSTFKFKN